MVYTNALFEHLLTDKDKHLLNLAQSFSEEYFTESNIRLWYAEGGIPDDVMFAFKESGLGYLGLSEAHDGDPTPFLTLILILEEFSRFAGTILPIHSQIATFYTLSQIATPTQIAYILDKYEQTARPCFSYAITDANANSGFENPVSRIEQRNQKIILNGGKSFVNNGEFAPYILVIARNLIGYDQTSQDKPPVTLWLVPKDSPGITFYPIHKIGQRALPAVAVQFHDVELSPEWQIGMRNISRETLLHIVSSIRCAACANSLGMAQAALEDAAHFAGKHVVAGKIISTYGQIAERLADMQAAVFSMRFLTYDAALCIQNNRDDIELVTSVLKRYVPQKAYDVANDGMRILGGIGYTDATRMPRLWADCRGNQYSTGTDEIMAMLAAREITRLYSQSSEEDSQL